MAKARFKLAKTIGDVGSEDRQAALREAAHLADAFADELALLRGRLREGPSPDREDPEAGGEEETLLTELSAVRAKEFQQSRQELERALGLGLQGGKEVEVWKQLAEVWTGLEKELHLAADEELELGPSPEARAKLSGLIGKVSDSEHQAALSEAARCSAVFAEELATQRSGLRRRQRGPGGSADPEEASEELASGERLEELAKEQAEVLAEAQGALERATKAGEHDAAEAWQQVVEDWGTLQESVAAVKGGGRAARRRPAAAEGSALKRGACILPTPTCPS